MARGFLYASALNLVMLIWLEGAPSDFSSGRNARELEAVTELGEAGYKGRHVVACRRELARDFATLDVLSARARAYFSRIYGEYTQLGSVFSIPQHLVASYSAITPSNVGGVWRVPLSYFADEVYLESLTVVCENDSDYEIYESLAKAWMHNNLPVCVVSARSRAGHGGSTVTVIRRLAVDPNPLYLCLLDSDRCMPLGGEGPTARGVKRGWHNSWRSTLSILECRELENAIPLQAIRRFLNSSGTYSAEMERFDRVDRDLADYVCMKSGEPICRFHSVDGAHVGYPRIRAALLSTARMHPDFSKCGSRCSDCDCKIVPVLGENFLESFAKWVRGQHVSRCLPASDEWLIDAERVAEIFAKQAIALPRRQ